MHNGYRQDKCTTDRRNIISLCGWCAHSEIYFFLYFLVGIFTNRKITRKKLASTFSRAGGTQHGREAESKPHLPQLEGGRGHGLYILV